MKDGDRVVQGDLIKLAIAGHFDVIVHGCNCFCTMGRGIAKQIRDELPEAYSADCATLSGDRSKLGNYTFAHVVRGNSRFVVVNAYTQYDWRGKGPKADYDAISEVFAQIARDFPAARIGYPMIGAGLAGGSWPAISRLIERELKGRDHTLVEYQPGPGRVPPSPGLG